MAETSTVAAQASAAGWLRAADAADLEPLGLKTVALGGRTLVLWRYEGRVYALDNRCPHMGFPLDRGTLRDGIVSCHWHNARFDLKTGGTFDQFADDVQVFPAEERDGAIWVDLSAQRDARAYYRRRLEDGLEQDIRLVLAKAAIALYEGGDAVEVFRAGLLFGVRNRRMGWGQGLTMLTCLARLLPRLDAEDRPRALFHGLDAVSRDTAGAAPRFVLDPLPGAAPDVATLKRWLRQFLEVRDDEGAERAVVSAVRAGATQAELADMLFAAATDHRYIQIGHALDFVNKAFDALDIAGWEPRLAEEVLASVVRGIAAGGRQEESNAWRHPIDLVAILHDAFPRIADALEAGRPQRGNWQGRDALAQQLLSEDPQANVDALLEALREGASEEQLAGAVVYAAALRIARFHTSQEHGDWDTTLHTFTFANAVQHGLRRAPSVELLRGAFDAAMSIYLDRFLNIPAARIPQASANGHAPEALLPDLLPLLDRQQQVNQAGELVARYLGSGGDEGRLLAQLGKALLREDRDFHTIQTVETAFTQYDLLKGTPAAGHTLLAAARYLAAHAPTARAQGQTYTIALRLHRGDKLFEE
jgi:nitrite reductase/ring-hydroxylating ferredoxin subunit